MQEAAAQGQQRQAALVVALVVWVRPQQRAAFSAWLCVHRAAAETRQLVRPDLTLLCAEGSPGFACLQCAWRSHTVSSIHKGSANILHIAASYAMHLGSIMPRQVALSLGRRRDRQLAAAFYRWHNGASAKSWQRQVALHFAARRQQQLLANAFASFRGQVGSSMTNVSCARILQC
jgi:hypothetical protein